MVEEILLVQWQRSSTHSVHPPADGYCLPPSPGELNQTTDAAIHQAMAAVTAQWKASLPKVTLQERKAPGVWKTDWAHFIDVNFRSLLQAVPPGKKARRQERLGQASILSTHPV